MEAQAHETWPPLLNRAQLPRPHKLPALRPLPVVALDIPVEDLLELGHDGVAAEGGGEFAVDVDGSLRLFKGAGQTDSKVGVLGFARPVDHAAHDGQLEFFDAGVPLAPLGHGYAQVALNLLGQLLEVSARRASATGTTGDLRHEAADSERLQNLLRGQHFLRAVAAGPGSEADADGEIRRGS